VPLLAAFTAVFLVLVLCHIFLSPPPSTRIPTGEMHSQIDLDPTHGVIRLTVLEEMVSLECAQDVYKQLSQVASKGGPYAAIYDLSMAKHTTIPTDRVRLFAKRLPPLTMKRKHVVVGKETHIFGLARLFQICSDNVGKEFEVVHTLEEAYEIVGVRPEDFTERLYPERVAA